MKAAATDKAPVLLQALTMQGQAAGIVAGIHLHHRRLVLAQRSHRRDLACLPVRNRCAYRAEMEIGNLDQTFARERPRLHLVSVQLRQCKARVSLDRPPTSPIATVALMCLWLRLSETKYRPHSDLAARKGQESSQHLTIARTIVSRGRRSMELPLLELISFKLHANDTWITSLAIHHHHLKIACRQLRQHPNHRTGGRKHPKIRYLPARPIHLQGLT